MVRILKSGELGLVCGIWVCLVLGSSDRYIEGVCMVDVGFEVCGFLMNGESLFLKMVVLFRATVYPVFWVFFGTVIIFVGLQP
jgi:hypothetical protein